MLPFTLSGLSGGSMVSRWWPAAITITSVWDLVSHQPASEAFEVRGNGVVFCLEAGERGGQAVIAGISSGSSTIQFWEVATGAPVGELVGLDERVHAIAFARREDQSVLAIATANRIQVVDTVTFEPIYPPIDAHSADVWSMSICRHDGVTFAASGDWGGRFCLWDVSTGAVLREPFLAHRAVVYATALLTEGPDLRLASVSYDATARVWDVTRLNDSRVSDDERFGAATCVSFAELGRRHTLVTGWADGWVRRLDAATGETVGAHLRAGGAPVVALSVRQCASGRTHIVTRPKTARYVCGTRRTIV